MERYANVSPNLLRQNTFTKLKPNFRFNENEETCEKSVHTSLSAQLYRSRFVRWWLFAIVILLMIIICYQLPYEILMKGLKAIAFGVMAVYFSWEIVYFDSTTPGVYPPSPLSVQNIRDTSYYVIDTSYLFSVINGILFTVMVYFWI